MILIPVGFIVDEARPLFVRREVSMDTNSIKVKIRRSRKESGQVISAVAVTPSSRIVGVVDITVPLMVGYSLSQRVGTDGEKAIEDLAEQLVRKVAEAVETSPQDEQS